MRHAPLLTRRAAPLSAVSLAACSRCSSQPPDSREAVARAATHFDAAKLSDALASWPRTTRAP